MLSDAEVHGEYSVCTNSGGLSRLVCKAADCSKSCVGSQNVRGVTNSMLEKAVGSGEGLILPELVIPCMPGCNGKP